jgi:tetratricopeptide (TPR) repeat protein
MRRTGLSPFNERTNVLGNMDTTLKRLGLVAGLLLAGCRGHEPAQSPPSDAVITARTLGLAYLRDGQLARAESAFQKVIDMAPGQALGYANLGLVHLRQGRYKDAEREIRKAAGLDTASDDIALMLATVYRLTQRPADARQEIDRVLRRSPTDLRALYGVVQLSPDSAAIYLGRIVNRTPANIAARLELIDVLLAQGAADTAAALFEGLQRQLPELPHETTRYFQQALSLARAGHASQAAGPETAFHHLMETTAAYQAALEHLRSANGVLAGYPILTFSPNMGSPTVGTNAVATAVRFADVSAAAGLDAVPALADSGDQAFAVGDYDGNGSEDLFVGGHLFRNDLGRSVDVTAAAGISLPSGDRPVAAAFGDYDNDGRLDLYVSTRNGGVLFRNVSDSTFTNTTTQAGLGSGPRAATALWLDLDHDGDLDLFLASPAGDRAYRNTLDGPFQDMTADVASPPSTSKDAAFGDFDDDGHTDLLLLGQDGHVRLLHNAGQGHFTDATAASGLGAAGPAHAGAITVGDYDNDGALDVLVTSQDGAAPVLYHNKGDGTFEVDARGSASLRALQAVTTSGATFFDFDNDGFLDLVIVGRRVLLFHNDGRGRFEDRSASLPKDLGSARKVAAVDWDHDGDLDLIVVGADGRPHLLLNDGGNANQYVQVQLAALRTGSGKNNDFGIGSTLELRAGPLYETRVVTGRVTHFGLGQRLKADVLRVHWPNGVSQTVYYPGTDEDVLEQQILKGSCPYLYAWDGHQFSFVTDVMWRSALGMPLGIMAGGRGIAAAPPYASREYMRIPGRALVPKDGRYALQITEELWETGYLDDARLLVVDHPDSLDVYLDEGFVPPGPGPATLELYPVAHPRLPIAATDERGNDWRAALLARDDRYVAPLEPTRYQGIATPHDLVLDFGDLSRMDSVYLFLSGWIFPTDASINLALAYSHGAGPQVVFPYLEVKDRAGQWRRVADVSFPSGKSKTVVVNLSGKFLSSDRRVRIRTNMEIYWDQAFVAARGPVTSTKVTTLDPVAADLHYRGFSTQYRKGGRYGPQWPDYAQVTRESPWEPIVGDFTRHGDVLPLLHEADDRYAVTAPGDEISLQFEAGALAPPPAGWTRDFVLYTDAWLKDSDRNTAAGGTVGPLPFHAMSRYPYGPNEAYPTDPVHQRYIEQYNTRHVGRQRSLATP